MKFSTRESFDLPPPRVFAAFSDFDAIERRIAARGIQIRRQSDAGHDGTGMTWESRPRLRGTERRIQSRVVRLEPDVSFDVASESGGITGLLTVEVLPTAKGSEARIGLELTPGTLKARLLLRSIKLMKPDLDRRFKSRVAAFADEIRRSSGAEDRPDTPPEA